jgi:xylulokinase
VSVRALGIDVGTTAVKVVVTDGTGTVLARGSARHAVVPRGDAGHAEIEPDQWWSSTIRALTQVPADVRQQVDVVGLSGNMSSVVLVDAEGRAVGPAILLADARGAEEIAALPADLVARVLAGSGNRPAPVFSLSTLLWLAHRRRCLLESSRYCSAKDWLRLRLCGGEPESEVTDAANTLLVDRRTLHWNRDLAGALGIPPALLPALRSCDEVVGRITGAAAAAIGLTAGTPVVSGAGDMASMAFGAGFGRSVDGSTARTALVSLGTSIGLLLPAADAAGAPVAVPSGPTATTPDGLTWHPAVDAGAGFRLASVITGGLALNWLTALTGTSAGTVTAEPLPIDDPLVFVPHLAGSAFPSMRAGVRGGILGLHPSAGAESLARALFEALAEELRLVVASVGAIDEVVLTGGGTRVPGWTAAIAETIDVPTTTLEEPEASARGAALLGLRGIGAGRSHPPGPERRVVAPDRRRVAVRDARRDRYLAARRTVFDHQA